MPAEHLGSVARSWKITYEKETNKGGSKIDKSGCETSTPDGYPFGQADR
jgi:hypothetical protein